MPGYEDMNPEMFEAAAAVLEWATEHHMTFKQASKQIQLEAAFGDDPYGYIMELRSELQELAPMESEGDDIAHKVRDLLELVQLYEPEEETNA